LSSVATRPLLFDLWKTFRSKPNAIPLDDRKLFAFPPESRSPSDRNAVRIHNGIVFAFRPESRSSSTGFPTFAREFLPKYADCKNFVNADLIAQGMAPFSPETAAIRAGKMMLSEMQSVAKRRLPFAFETTLTGRSYMGLLRRLKAQGYEVYLFFVGRERGSRIVEGSENESCVAGTMCQNR
jgi:hypothetical protein